MMDKNEKVLLLQLILEDIRSNWGWQLEERVEKALDLAIELRLNPHIEAIKAFLGDMKTGNEDGRVFRGSYKWGGYLNMGELHQLSPSILDKSKSFQINAENILTFPKNRFTDWNKYMKNRGDS